MVSRISANSAAQRELLYQSASIGHLIAEAIGRFADREAFRTDGRATTYRELGELVSRICQAFDKLGLEPGDTVTMLAGNAMETYALLAAIYISDLKAVSLQTLGGAEDHRFIIGDADTRLMLLEPEFEERGALLREACPDVRHWFAMGKTSGFDDFWDLMRALSPRKLSPRGTRDSIARLAYTGGTTGRPKGVMISNRVSVTQTTLCLAVTHYEDPPRYLCALPITHGAGSLLTGILTRGGTVIVQRKFEARKFIDALIEERCNATWMVPTAIYAVLDHPRAREVDWSGLKTLVYSGAPMAAPRIREALDVFGPCLVQMYGQAEAPGHVLLLTQSEHARASLERLTSAGRPFPGLLVDILDDESNPVPQGEIGEICVRGQLVMEGYWKQPEQTEAAFAKGWLHTGDLARRDADGFYYIVDRKKDMLITGGFNVYPKEVEDTLARHPAVSQAAVIGLPDSRWGEAATAFIVLRDGQSVEGQTLMDLVRADKGPVNVPKKIHFVPSLPLTSVGKVDKKALRAQQLAQT